VDKFIARENIRHFRDRVETETDPAVRSRLHKLLVVEEDKLGHNSETLYELETHIADGKKRVNRQQTLVASMERDGRDTTDALTLLTALSETPLIFENRRKAILIGLNQSVL
jgi:hypothetical protein